MFSFLLICIFLIDLPAEEKPGVSETTELEEGSDDLGFEDARDYNNLDKENENDGDQDEDDNCADEDGDQLMVVETPEGLTLVDPIENSSFYIVQENEGQETPPGMIMPLFFRRLKNTIKRAL